VTAGARRLHLGDAFGSFRRSLGLRMVALTLSIGIVLIVLLTLVVSNLIRDDVFEDRSVAILSDAHQRGAAAQAGPPCSLGGRKLTPHLQETQFSTLFFR